MQFPRAVVFATTFHAAVATFDTPIQKVLGILADCEAKIVADGKAEQKGFDKYVDWCKTGSAEKGFEIKTATADIADLKATIEKSASDIETAGAKIESLAQEVTAANADLKEQIAMRKKENDEFLATEKELVETVDTLERATNILQRKMRGASMLDTTVKTGTMKHLISLLGTVVDAAGFELHDKKMLVAFAQSEDQDDDDLDQDAFGAPDPAAYESKSSSITDVLEDLKQKAETQLSELRKVEATSQNNFAMTKQSLEDQIEVNNKELDDEKAIKANAQETGAQAKGELEVTTKDLATAKETLQNMAQDCMDVATDHEISSKSRKEELKAIGIAEKAIKDLTSGAESATYGFFQIASHPSGAHFEVVNMVRNLAHAQHSTALAQLAGRISSMMKEASVSGVDPFVKIKGMLSDMVSRLEKEHAEEASHKAYCDKETKETKTKMGELKYDIEKFSGKLDKSKSDSARLKDEVAELQRELAEITRSQTEADANRLEQKKVYVKFKTDLEQGLEGVRMALKVLRDYYANSESSLVQEPTADGVFAQQPEKPGGHSAKSGAGNGVISMLEIVESDFGKNLADIEMEEDTLASEYEKLTMDNKVSKMLKEKDVKYKTKEAANLDKSITELATDLASTQSELDAVLEYSSKIRGMCELKPDTYESRAARRESEIDGLKAALEALEGDTAGAAFLQKPHALLRGVSRH